MCAAAAEDAIVACTRANRVIPLARIDVVIARTGEDLIIAAAAIHDVDTAQAAEDIISRRLPARGTTRVNYAEPEDDELFGGDLLADEAFSLSAPPRKKRRPSPINILGNTIKLADLEKSPPLATLCSLCILGKLES